MNTPLPPTCPICALWGQPCCKLHRYRADCKLLCAEHPAFNDVDADAGKETV